MVVHFRDGFLVQGRIPDNATFSDLLAAQLELGLDQADEVTFLSKGKGSGRAGTSDDDVPF